MKTIFDVQYNGENYWGYELKNKVTKKWYLGYAKRKDDRNSPEDYVMSSNITELNCAISKGEIVRHVSRVDNSEISIKTWETQELIERDAENDPNSYNHNNGMSTIKKLPNIEMLSSMAKSVVEDHEISGVRATTLNLEKHKELNKKGIGELIETSPCNNWVTEQVRELFIDSKHVKDIKMLIDDHHGSLEQIENITGQKLLVVILKDYKYSDGRVVDLKVGGNHSWEGTIKSRFGWEIPILEIPPSIHRDWSEQSVKIFGELLNPRDKKKIMGTKPDDTVRTCVDLVREFGKGSQLINDLLIARGYLSDERKSIKGKVATRIENEDEIAKQKSLNFNDWKSDESKEIMKKRKKGYDKEPTTLVRIMSTGKAGIGNLISRDLYTIQNGNTKIKKLIVILYHPTIRYKEKFDKEYIKYFKSWKVTLKLAHNVDLSWEEMPSYQ